MEERRISVEPAAAAARLSGMDRPLPRRRGWARKSAGLALLAVIAASLGYAIFFRESRSSLEVNRERLVISTVRHGPFQELIPVNGTVVPIHKFFLNAVEGGRVERIFREAGSMVEAGDPILELTNTDLFMDIMWREAEVFQQSNNLRTTRLLMEQYRLQIRRELAELESQILQQSRILARSKALAKDGLIPLSELELVQDQHEYLLERKRLTVESQDVEAEFRRAQVEALEASLGRMQGNLAVVRQKLEDLTIRAPISGHLTALTAEVGQFKVPGEELGQIDILDGFKVRASVDEHYIARVEEGSSASFEFDGHSYQVELDKIYPEVQDGRFEVDLVFRAEAPAGIRRGQTLRVRLQLGDAADATLLPRGGFLSTTGGNWAYVLDESGSTAARTPIGIGRQNPDVFEVRSGLQPGDRVVTSSYDGFGAVDQLILK